MPRRPHLIGRARRDNCQSLLLRTKSNVDVHIVDPRVREDPHRVALVERIALHYRVAVALRTLEKEELMNSHFAGDAREERQRQLYHRMEPDETANSRIHLLDRNRRVAASERVHT